MEAIIGWIIIIAFFIGIGRVFRWITSASKATAKTLSGKGSLTANLADEFREMGKFEVRTIPTQVELSGRMVPAIDVEMRGLINAPRQSDLTFVTSLFDFTDGQWNAVLSSLDVFQEKSTQAFQRSCDAGTILPNQGYKNWIWVSRFFPETLIGVRSGTRKIRVFVRGLPKDEIAKVNLGLHDKEIEMFCGALTDLEINLVEKGWLEAVEQRNEARALVVRIAVAVAMQGGQLTPTAGRTIQDWIRRELSTLQEGSVDPVKAILNTALTQSFAACEGGAFEVDAQIARLGELGFRAVNQSLIELLVELAGVDEASGEHFALVRRVGALLDVDYTDIQAMSDKRLLKMDSLPESQESIEALLGIEKTWDNDKIRRHIASEFVKWNGRVNSLEGGAEKENAQRMLGTIAAARSKYG